SYSRYISFKPALFRLSSSATWRIRIREALGENQAESSGRSYFSSSRKTRPVAVSRKRTCPLWESRNNRPSGLIRVGFSSHDCLLSWESSFGDLPETSQRHRNSSQFVKRV